MGDVVQLGGSAGRSQVAPPSLLRKNNPRRLSFSTGCPATKLTHRWLPCHPPKRGLQPQQKTTSGRDLWSCKTATPPRRKVLAIRVARCCRPRVPSLFRYGGRRGRCCHPGFPIHAANRHEVSRPCITHPAPSRTFPGETKSSGRQCDFGSSPDAAGVRILRPQAQASHRE